MKNSTYFQHHIFYDSLLNFSKNDLVTSEEVKMIIKYANFACFDTNKTKLLDIGGGTGRHAIYLLRNNFDVDIIEKSPQMYKILISKISSLPFVEKQRSYNVDFYRFKKKYPIYSVIYSFWNVINEMCKTIKDLSIFFRKTYTLLIPGGYCIINTEDLDNYDSIDIFFENLNYEYYFIQNNKKYLFESILYRVDRKKKITCTIENIFELGFSKNETSKILKSKCYLIQKWWTKYMIIYIAEKEGMDFNCIEKIKYNDEIYIVFRKPG
ncbi:MAG: class I SAM-dependent methyltransferase [Candidatus Dojkabacteria bacterium]|nr:class I SAM-dependent methyltransferase [Candidatus Dojkabacteria bacterium]